MKITVRPGSKRSVNTAVQAINDALYDRDKNMDLFLRRLTEVGERKARELFAAAEYDGDNDVTVTAERTDRGYRIVASGQSVAFIEFGSGVTMPSYPADAAVQHERGTFGQGKGADPRGWVYVGEQGTGGIPMRNSLGEVKPGVYRTKGNPPAAAMYHAVRAMQEAAPQIAREVFGS